VSEEGEGLPATASLLLENSTNQHECQRHQRQGKGQQKEVDGREDSGSPGTLCSLKRGFQIVIPRNGSVPLQASMRG
jgi:hypothetical protein